VIDTQVVWQLVVRPLPLSVLFITLVVAAVFGSRIPRHGSASGRTGGLFLAAVGVVVTLTCTADTRNVADFAPEPGALGFLRRLVDFDQVAATVTTPPATGEQLANVALYIPAGLLAYALWRSAVKSVGFCVLLSVTIETWQSYVGRSAELIDIRNNVFGSILGVLLYVIAGPRVRAWTSQMVEEARVKQVLAFAAVTIGVLLTVVVSMPLLVRLVL